MLANYATLNHDEKQAYGGLSGAKKKLGKADSIEIQKTTTNMRIRADERYTIVRSATPFVLHIETREMSKGDKEVIVIK